MVDFTKLPIGTRVETAYGPGHIVSSTCHYVTVRVGDADYHYTPSGGIRCGSDERPTLFLAPFEWPTQEQPEVFVKEDRGEFDFTNYWRGFLS